jgi:DNA-binding transcriptional regulator/RsmH inhibitor MraZ
VTLDKAGRITIPDEFCTRFSLSKEVWLSGAVDTFNIWNVSEFEADRARQEAAAADVMSQLGI